MMNSRKKIHKPSPFNKRFFKRIEKIPHKIIQGTFTASLDIEEFCDETTDGGSSWITQFSTNQTSELPEDVFESLSKHPDTEEERQSPPETFRRSERQHDDDQWSLTHLHEDNNASSRKGPVDEILSSPEKSASSDSEKFKRIFSSTRLDIPTKNQSSRKLQEIEEVSSILTLQKDIPKHKTLKGPKNVMPSETSAQGKKQSLSQENTLKGDASNMKSAKLISRSAKNQFALQSLSSVQFNKDVAASYQMSKGVSETPKGAKVKPQRRNLLSECLSTKSVEGNVSTELKSKSGLKLRPSNEEILKKKSIGVLTSVLDEGNAEHVRNTESSRKKVETPFKIFEDNADEYSEGSIISDRDQSKEKTAIKSKKKNKQRRKTKEKSYEESISRAVSTKPSEAIVEFTESVESNKFPGRISGENVHGTLDRTFVSDREQPQEKATTLKKNKYKRKSDQMSKGNLSEAVSTKPSEAPNEESIENNEVLSRIYEEMTHKTYERTFISERHRLQEETAIELKKKNKHKRKSDEMYEENLLAVSTKPSETNVESIESLDRNKVPSRTHETSANKSVERTFISQRQQPQEGTSTKLKKNNKHKRKSDEMPERSISAAVSSKSSEANLEPIESEENNGVPSRIHKEKANKSYERTFVSESDQFQEETAIKSKKKEKHRSKSYELCEENISTAVSTKSSQAHVMPIESAKRNRVLSRISEERANEIDESLETVTDGGRSNKTVASNLTKKTNLHGRKTREKLSKRRSTQRISRLLGSFVAVDSESSEDSVSTNSSRIPERKNSSLNDRDSWNFLENNRKKKFKNRKVYEEESEEIVSTPDSTTVTDSVVYMDTGDSEENSTEAENSTEKFLTEMNLYETLSEESVETESSESKKRKKELEKRKADKEEFDAKSLSEKLREYEAYLQTIPICDLSLKKWRRKEMEQNTEAEETDSEMSAD